jgi:hypothetical protein
MGAGRSTGAGRRSAPGHRRASAQPAPSAAAAPTRAGVGALQRAIGNSAVAALLTPRARRAPPAPGRAAAGRAAARPAAATASATKAAGAAVPVQRMALTAEILREVAGRPTLKPKKSLYKQVVATLAEYDEAGGSQKLKRGKLLETLAKLVGSWLAKHAGRTHKKDANKRLYLPILLQQVYAELAAETLRDPRLASLYQEPRLEDAKVAALKQSQNKLVVDAIGFYLSRAPELRDLILGDDFLRVLNKSAADLPRLTWNDMILAITTTLAEHGVKQALANPQLGSRPVAAKIADLASQKLSPAELVTRVALLMRGALSWVKSGPDPSFNVKHKRDLRDEGEVAQGKPERWEYNSFGAWIRLLEGKPEAAAKYEPTISAASTMNCWEVVLFAAYHAGQFSAERLVGIHQEARKRGQATGQAGYFAALADALGYPRAAVLKRPGKQLGDWLPARGDVVFFEEKPYALDHVALAVGGVEVMSLWSKGTGSFDLVTLGSLDSPELTISVTSPFR